MLGAGRATPIRPPWVNATADETRSEPSGSVMVVSMDSRSRAAFGLLILAQAAHSVEEYVYRLFDVFGPARFVSSLFSSNIAVGFVLANLSIVLFGVWCYLARVRRPRASERGYAWFWTCLELANGVGHVLFSIRRGSYFPGVGTAPLLIATSSYLAARLTRLGRVS